jgi:predicted outer membrane repeat protein
LGYSAGDPLIRQPSNGTLSVSASTFAGNSAGSTAAGGGGADLFNFNGSNSSYSINSSTFSSNTATSGSGGAIIVESGPLTLTTSSLSGNTANNRGGAIFSGSSVAVTFSRLTGNSVSTAVNGLTIFSSAGTASADDNWWGINTGPSTNDFRNNVGSVFPASYLQLRVSANPSSICAGGTSTLTADIKQRNLGAALTTELNGLPTFTALFNNAALGSLSGATNFVNGVATATSTAGGTPGMGSADVTADNQLVSATITIGGTQTTDPSDQTVCQGDTANFSTTASGSGPFSYAWKLDGSPFNGDNPSISVPTGSLSIGPHTVDVTVTGSCGTAVQSATLTVQAPTATTDPADQLVCKGTDAHFSTTASGTGPFHYVWTLDGSPFNGDSPSITVPTGSLSTGNHTVDVTTTGGCGSAMQTATLTVGGAPVITLSKTTDELWPPNHQYHTFNVTDFVASASSSCDSSVDINDVVIQKTTSDEPENSAGADGNTVNDIVIAPDCKSVQLRAERDGDLNGRVYTITFKVTDSFGNSTTVTVTVTVPINHNGTAVDDGPAAGYTVNSLCP